MHENDPNRAWAPLENYGKFSLRIITAVHNSICIAVGEESHYAKSRRRNVNEAPTTVSPSGLNCFSRNRTISGE